MSGSYILVGMRGAGKTTIGQMLAKALEYDHFIDLDWELENQEQKSIQKLIELEGWEGFRRKEAKLLMNKAEQYPKSAVIATGGGVIETLEAREFLEKYPRVIHISCPIEEIVSYLNKEAEKNAQAISDNESERRPQYAQSIEETFNRRKGFYFACSNYQFAWSPKRDYSQLKASVRNFAHRLVFSHFPEFCSRQFCPSLLHVDIGVEYETKFSSGYDGLMIDISTLMRHFPTLECDSKLKILQHLSAFRHLSPLPLVVFFRSHDDYAKGSEYLPFLEQSLVEYLLLLNGTEEVKKNLPKSTTSTTIVIDFPNIKMYSIGQAEENRGCERYFLFGNPISASPSPTLHNTAFSLLKNSSLEVSSCESAIFVKSETLEFTRQESTHLKPKKQYYLFQTVDARALEYAIAHPCFRGASVTIPFKEKVNKFASGVSESAKKIGAINTLVRNKENAIYADNTDWLGIKALLEPALVRRGGGKTALVVGAGGTSRAAIYCAQFLGLDTYIYNRTIGRAVELATLFQVNVVENLEKCEVIFDVVISTVPSKANFILPVNIVSMKPVVVEAAYKPRDTALVKQTMQAGSEVFVGVQMLIEQGLEQSRLWNELTLEEICYLRHPISEKVMEFYSK